jgi:exosortase/archaeosortase
MKRKKYIALITLGALLMSFTFILKHYITVPDLIDGLLKGVALGLLILTAVIELKKKNQPERN